MHKHTLTHRHTYADTGTHTSVPVGDVDGHNRLARAQILGLEALLEVEHLATHSYTSVPYYVQYLGYNIPVKSSRCLYLPFSGTARG